MTELGRKVGEMNYDGLISGLNPAVRVTGGVIAAGAEERTYVRGTVFARSKTTNKLYVIGTETEEELVPDCVLCDDVTVGTEDETVAVYAAGCFNTNKITVAEGYTMTADDLDQLRMRSIVFVAALN